MNTTPTSPASPGQEPENAPRRRTGKVAATVTALTLAVGGSALVPALAAPGAAAPAEEAPASSDCTVAWHAEVSVAPDGSGSTTHATKPSEADLLRTHTMAFPFPEEGQTQDSWTADSSIQSSMGFGTTEDLTDLKLTTTLKTDGARLTSYSQSGVFEDGFTSYNLQKTDTASQVSADGKTMTSKVTKDGTLPAKNAVEFTAITENLGDGSALVGAATPVVMDMELTAQKASCAAPTAPAEGTTTYTYDDGAVLNIPQTWTRGEDLHLTGTGFTTTDHSSGSTVAVKLNSGGISRKTAVPGQKNKTIWVMGQADDQGSLSIDVPFPTMQDSDLAAELADDESVDITLLSGSLKAGDNPRGGIPGSSRVVPAAAQPSASHSASASASAAPTAPATSTSPSASASATAQPSETTEPSSSASATQTAESTETASPTSSTTQTAEPTGSASPTSTASPEPTDSVTAEPTAQAEELTHTYDDGATVAWSSLWEYGKPLTLKGTGFLTQDKSAGSTVALKLNSGGINHLTPVEGQKNASIWVVATADAQGSFTVQAPFPTTANSDLDAALEPGEVVDLTLLSGSLKTGDTVRGGSFGETTVGPKAATADPSGTPAPTATATAQPSQSPEPTTEPSAEPTVEETEIVVTEPETTEDPGGQSGTDQGTATDDTVCSDLGATDLSTDDPQYSEALDRDNDGVACEGGNGNGVSGPNADGGAANGGSDGSGSGQAGSSSGDLASTGAGQNTGLLISGGIFVVTAGAALVVLARRRATR